MFDFEKWSKKQTEKILLWLNIDNDPIYSPRFRKFIRWFGFKFNPFILNIASVLLLIFILNRINSKFGIEKMLIIAIVIIIFTLRGISNEIQKLTN